MEGAEKLKTESVVAEHDAGIEKEKLSLRGQLSGKIKGCEKRWKGET